MAKTRDTSTLIRASLLQKLGGYVNTQLIYLLAKWRIADLLAGDAKSSHWLAQEIGLDEERLHRILRGCVNAGLLAETESGAFATTPATQLLESERPDSLRSYALLTGEVWYPAWGHLLAGIEAEETPFRLAFDTNYYDYYEQMPELGSYFNQFMQARTVQSAHALVETYDFSAVSRVVDVGGGNGTLLQIVLEKYPALSGVLCDLPDVVAEAKQRLAAPETGAPHLGDRLHYVGGSFLQTVPEGGDCYILSQILHNWPDEQCVQILRNCHTAMTAGSKLLILEQLIPEKLGGLMPAVEMDLMMLVLLEGRERTEATYRALLSTLGFEIVEIQSLKYLGYCLVEVQKQ